MQVRLSLKELEPVHAVHDEGVAVADMSDDPGMWKMMLARILRLGTERNRWAVRDIYVDITKEISFASEVRMVANQLADYPEGAAFVRQRTKGLSLPLRILQALVA